MGYPQGGRGRKQYNNDMTVTMFENDRKRGDKDPDMKGQAEVDGVEYWASGWWNQNSRGGGDYLKIKLSLKDDNGGRNGSGNNRSGNRGGGNGYGAQGGRSGGRQQGGGERGGYEGQGRSRGNPQHRMSDDGGYGSGGDAGGFNEMDDDIPF